MPGYEFSLIVKSMARPKIVEAVKRAAGKVYESGGYIRYIWIFSVLLRGLGSLEENETLDWAGFKAYCLISENVLT